MKKILCVTTLVFVLCFCFASAAFAAPLTLEIDGTVVRPSVDPMIDNGVTLVPLRFIAETLGAEVNYNAASRSVTVETAAYSIVLTVGSTGYTVNGAARTMLAAPQIVNDFTMVPLRVISEAIGAQVEYIADTSTVTVSYFTTMSGSVKVSGSTTVQPIAQAAADKLMLMNSGLSITVAGGGSGAGINDAKAGTSNIGLSSRELTDDELQELTPYIVAQDGIAVIVHPSNPVGNLTKEQASQLFLGEITNWADVGGNNAPVFVQTRETGSGTRSTLEEMLLNRESVLSTATPSTSSALIKQSVAGSANAIGYDSIGFVDSSVKAVSLDNVNATEESVKSGNYLMGRDLLVVTKGRPSGASAMFIDYLRSKDCQDNFVVKEGYISLY
ncbi:MAG: phosphate ABC transporter substrate-binding protein PstS family protein [Clostridiales bacterium]|nr:phosphate ABC transporter substrate-binding protein PstS family protein [Clostridiales bacterium]